MSPNSFLCLNLLLICQVMDIASQPTVKTSWGEIQGVYSHTENGETVKAYLGIPFALPPIGDLRFKKPVAHSVVTTTFKADSLSKPCPQMGPNGTVIGDEDCLFLNVYTPSNKSTSQRAVMVWIHGGSLVSGGAKDYNPSALVTLGDVIVVTIQYRLGPMGFLSMIDDACKGNFGLWDQILALKWVKENIAGFGGNPGQVTLFGQSMGSESIGLLTISPLGRGLFQRAILQSGTVEDSWAITRSDELNTASFAKLVSCDLGKSEFVLKCLREVPASTLIMNSFPVSEISPFKPVVDKEIILDIPRELLSRPDVLKLSNFSKYDIMIGVNNNETGMFEKPANFKLDVSFFKSNILKTCLVGFYGTVNSDMIDVAAFEYLYPNFSSMELQSIINTKLDAIFVVPGIHFARTHAASDGNGRTYFYYFNHDPKDPFKMNTEGMIHGYDLAYTFGFNKEILKVFGLTKNQISASDRKLSETFRRILIQFAKSGDPSPAVQPDVPTWPQYDLHTQQYLNLDDNLTIRDHLLDRRVSLWLDLLPKLQD